MERTALPLLLLLVGLATVTLACNGGYKLRLKKIENCAGSDAIITADQNFTVVLNKNCEIKSRGCVRFRDFKTGIAKYAVTKDGVQVLKGSANICDREATIQGNRDIDAMLRTLGVPEKCPVSAGTICTDPSQVININRFRQYLPLARGAISINVNVQHDSGKSCLKIRFDITK